MTDANGHEHAPKGEPNGGQFVSNGETDSGKEKTAEKTADAVRKYSDDPAHDLKEMGLPAKKPKIVEVEMDAEVQKRLDSATTKKERQKIAFRYIMDTLRGKYSAADGRTVAIERVGADKITSKDNREKLRACPALADMIKAGEYSHSAPAENKPKEKFVQFAYYSVRVKMGNEMFDGLLNVGIRKDGSSTLYDLRPLVKQEQ